MADYKAKVTEEQVVYAGILGKGMKAGLLGILVTCAIYMLGVLPAVVPVDEVSNYWGMSVHDYLAATGVRPGWSWLGELGKGDVINFLPIAFLAGVTIICYAAIIPVFLRKKDTVYTVVAVLEVVVLLLVASGVVGGGGH